MKTLTLFLMLFLFLNISFSQQSLDSLRLVLPVGHNRSITKTVETEKFIITSSYDTYVKLWDKASFRLLSTNSTSKGSVNDLVFDSKRSTVIFGSEDSTISFWSINLKGISETTKISLKDVINRLVIDTVNDVLFIVEGRQLISKWDIKTKKILWRKKIKNGDVNTIELNQWTNQLFVLLFGGGMEILNLTNEKNAKFDHVEVYESFVYKYTAINKENYFTTSFDGELTWWNKKFDQGRKNFKIAEKLINDFDLFKTIFVAGSNDGYLYILDLINPDLKQKIKFEDWVINVKILESKESIIAIDTKGNLKLIDLLTGSIIKELYLGVNVSSMVISKNEDELICSTFDGDVLRVSLKSFELKGYLVNEANPIYNIISKEESVVITANEQGNYHYIDFLQNFQIEYTVYGITEVSYPNNEGEFLLANDTSAEAFNFLHSNKSQKIYFENNLITLAGYSESGKVPFIVYRDYGLYILDSTKTKILKKNPKVSGYNYVLTVEFLNNDSTIVVGETEGGLMMSYLFSDKNNEIDLNLKDPSINEVFFIKEISKWKIFIAVTSFSVNQIDTKTGNLIKQKQFKNKIISSCILNNRLYILFSDNILQIRDVKTLKLVQETNFPFKVYGLYPNRNRLICKSNDGTIYFINQNDLNYKFSYLALKNNNWLVKLPNSPYYMCSKDASKMLHYVTPSLKVIGFEQLDPVYNRPDIVLDSIGKYFGNSDRGMIDEYRKSWEKRIDRLGLDKELLGKGEIAVPSAEIINADVKTYKAPMIEYTNSSGKTIIHVKATDSKYKLKRYNVYVNEVPVYGSLGRSITHLNTSSWEGLDSITLSKGENKIQVSVMNELGLENFKYPSYVNYTPSEPIVAKTYYIGIGVNEFKESSHNLKYCVKDVTDLSTSFGGPNTEVKLFTNAQVTKENILALKDYLSKTTVNDKVIISCSSHGLLDDSSNFYLATHDVDFNNPKARGLKYEELESLLDGIPARQKLLLLDACNSGENDKTEILKQDLAKNQPNMNKETIEGAKGVIIKLEDENKSNFKKMNELFVNVRNNTGSVIISAAGGQESALEAITVDGKSIENGAFSYCVLEYLKNKTKNPEELTVNQLKNYVEKRVEEITNGKQQPTSRQETMEVDWRLR